MSDVIRVRVAHRSRLFQECLVAALSRCERLETLPIDHHADVGLLAAADPPPHVVLLDLHLPDRRAVRWAEEIRRRLPDAKVMVLAPGDAGDALFECMAAGAHGCILETTSIEHLHAAIVKVHCGEAYYSPEIVQTLFRRVTQTCHPVLIRPRAEPSDLTRREIEVVRFIADNLSNKQIARRLHISLHTVKNHVHNIVEKLQVSNRHQAVEYARQRQWLNQHEGAPT